MNKETKVWPADEPAIAEAARTLREGGIVAFPTETVYGLGADARNPQAVRRVFEAKGRPSDNPLIVHIADRGQLEELVLPYGEIPARLMEAFWPGPLTIVLPVRPGAAAPQVTAGLDTVAVRMPAHPVALRLIAAAGCPVAAPSANRSGRPSPTLAAHVLEDLAGRIDGVVDGGQAEVGLESTVVMVEDDRIRVLRPGGVTREALAEAAGCDVVAEGAASGEGEECGDQPGGESNRDAAPRSPGMKYAHYAPRGEMTLVIGDGEAVRAWIGREAAAARAAGCRTGVLTFEEHAGYYDADAVVVCGSLARPEQAAQRLYAALREFDARGIGRIWAEGCPPEGIGLALMNRLAKAAGGRIVRV
ncbi:MAG: threonylcarbamoyl-AMP synthase [Thermobacillus sp.]|uniref:L-threonylcarbamoyladenylate synthase n=1 Tax=Thermobacillus sp. TaxID=2108467 RepID=UPI000E3A5C58|nr:L-threonylcarbamoyladenylate synthase [Thermobacillus sp.]REK55442.1 MAG: threonylcarbamoyl-AMP synthase [Thermobacillus sp.]